MKFNLLLAFLVPAVVFCPSCKDKDAVNRYPVRTGGKWAYIDASGKLAVQPQFDEAGFFSEGLAPVCVGRCDFTEGGEYEGKWGYIDASGKMVISPRFDGAQAFHVGLAAVFVGKRTLREGDGKYGYIKSAENLDCTASIRSGLSIQPSPIRTRDRLCGEVLL